MYHSVSSSVQQLLVEFQLVKFKCFCFAKHSQVVAFFCFADPNTLRYFFNLGFQVPNGYMYL